MPAPNRFAFTLAPPVEREEYHRRLTAARSLNFNFVRHHSHILPRTYFEVASELGMLVSVEFPMLDGNRCGAIPGLGKKGGERPFEVVGQCVLHASNESPSDLF